MIEKYNCLSKLNPNEFERILGEWFIRFHKCPWHKVLFKEQHPAYSKYEYIKTYCGGIGYSYSVVCKDCGESFDITDYNEW